MNKHQSFIGDFEIHLWNELFELLKISFDCINKDDIHPWTPNKSQKNVHKYFCNDRIKYGTI